MLILLLSGIGNHWNKKPLTFASLSSSIRVRFQQHAHNFNAGTVLDSSMQRKVACRILFGGRGRVGLENKSKNVWSNDVKR